MRDRYNRNIVGRFFSSFSAGNQTRLYRDAPEKYSKNWPISIDAHWNLSRDFAC